VPVYYRVLPKSFLLFRQPFLILAFFGALPASCLAADYGKVTTHKVADGVYLFTTTPYADVGFCGNSVAIIGSDGVLVFDSAATPETAQTILWKSAN
jgi:hypothetical protein